VALGAALWMALCPLLVFKAFGDCLPPPSGLVSWWRAEGNGLEQADSNNGTLIGNTTFGPGRVGQAFVFDGSGDAVAVGSGANLQLQNFTIESWIKRCLEYEEKHGEIC